MVEQSFGNRNHFLFFTYLFLPITLQEIIGWSLVAYIEPFTEIKKQFRFWKQGRVYVMWSCMSPRTLEFMLRETVIYLFLFGFAGKNYFAIVNTDSTLQINALI